MNDRRRPPGPRILTCFAALFFLGLIGPTAACAKDFVSLGSTWKYHRGTSHPSPTELSAWRQPDFDDSGWESGVAGIGYGDNDDQTHLGDMSGNYWSVYARQTFEVADLASVEALRLAICFDDGFVAYLNGHELHRVNAGSVGEELSHSDPATGDHDADAIEEYDRTSRLQQLVQGENVLAFEIHNVTLTSTDLSFNARLSDEGPPIEIFDFGEGWRFFRGNTAPPATWREPTFDHSSWEAGPLSVGYGDSDDATHLDDMEGNYLAVFLRKRFNVSYTGDMKVLHLIVDFDDGFIAHLNGQEIARRNCGEPGEVLDLAATATSPREAGAAEFVDISDQIDHLVIGENFLAIEVRNYEVTSSDLSIDVRLSANERLPHFVPIPVGVAGLKAAFADFNNDGLVDVLTDGLWRNDGNGSFTEVVDGLAHGIWADFDNDGFLDIFAYGGRRLFRNINGESFQDVSGSMLPAFPMSETRGAVWGDFDGDAFVDLYVGGYEIWPNPYQPDVILMNEGGESFRTAWTQSGDVDPARGITAVDFDEDGDIDVYVSNYRLEQNQLWTNNGSGGFSNTAPSRGVEGTDDGFTWSYGHTIGSAFGDLDSDGHIDLFVGNFSHPDAFQDRPRFYRNRGPSFGWSFEDRSADAQLGWKESFASPSLGDMDNDGDLDLHFTAVYVGDRPVLYENNGDFRFKNVSSTIGSGLVRANTYQSAWADIDNDGDLDLLTGGSIHANTGNANGWLKVRLHGDGIVVNRAAIGAQARVSVNGSTMARFVGGGMGEGNQNDLTLHFGLGSFDGDEVPLEVFWPDGTLETTTVAPNQTIEFTYGETLCGAVRDLPDSYLDELDETVLVEIHARNIPSLTVLRERIPEGWTVVDAGGGQVLNGGSIQWLVSQDALLTYEVRPSGACGEATFSGTYTGNAECIGPIGGNGTTKCTPTGPRTALVEEGDTIRYLRGTTMPSTGWQLAEFDDSTWLPGRIGIGYDDGDDRTVLGDMLGNYESVFGRVTFNPEDRGVFLDEIRRLQLGVRFDDGCVISLNGTELMRPNMISGAITNQTLSEGHVDDAPATCDADGAGCRVITFSADLLTDGENVLSFSVHNATIDSSDLSFIPTLEAFTRSNGTRFRRGDVNADGGVDVVDGVRILRWLFLGVDRSDCLDSADADNDSQPAIADALRVLTYLFLAGPAPEDPGPTTCGVDDDKALGCDFYLGCGN